MKEVRPSTWVLLGVLVLFIFGPLFLLDIEPIQDLEPTNQPGDPVRPVGPGARPANSAKPANKPAANTPAENQPERQPRENGVLD